MEKALLNKSAAQGLRSLQSWIAYQKDFLKNYEDKLRAELEQRGDSMNEKERGDFYGKLATVIREDLTLRYASKTSSLLRAAARAGIAPDADARERRGAGGKITNGEQRQHKPTTIYGYGAVFDSPTTIAGLFTERIAPGAFTACLKDSARCEQCVCLNNHDPNLLLGRLATKTLELREDDTGLFYECFLADTTQGNDVYQNVLQRNLIGNSFSFTVRRDSWKLAQKIGELDERLIEEIGDLFDTGPVTFPAYPETTVTVSRCCYDLDKLDDEFELAEATRQRLADLEQRLAKYRKK